MRTRPDLIVPIRDRRRRKRILTLKNFRNLVLVAAVFFAGVTIQSDLRHPRSGDYGSLFGKQVSGQMETSAKKLDVIREAPVIDQTSADPLLVAPAAREQYLGVDNAPQQTGLITAQPLDAPRANVAIVSGPNGVTIVRGDAAYRPTLSGGIFRQ